MLRFAYLLIGCSSLCFAGCGGGADGGGVPVYPVSGTITMNGGPVAGASVTFSPKSGQPAAAGRTDNSGNFTVTTYTSGDGAAEGDFVVLVRKFAIADPSAEPDADAGHSTDAGASLAGGHAAKSGGDESGNLLPGNFGNKDSSPLNVTVKAEGENKFELKLE